jgi:dynein light intermediate chain 1
MSIPISAENLSNIVVVTVLDYSQLWDLESSLVGWLGSIKKAVAAAMEALPQAERSALLEKNVARYQKEAAAIRALELGQAQGSASQVSLEADDAPPPLDDATLTTNIGVPIVVVCAKTDCIEALDKEHDYKDAHHDFVQLRLRRLCLAHGASLIYTSSKSDINSATLFDHLNHLALGFPTKLQGSVADKAAVFVPAGFDSASRLAALASTLPGGRISASSDYNDVIPIPKPRKAPARAEAVVEDEQAFLASHFGKTPSAARPVTRSTAASAKEVTTVAGGKPTNPEAFFNSLLKGDKGDKKKEGAGN